MSEPTLHVLAGDLSVALEPHPAMQIENHRDGAGVLGLPADGNLVLLIATPSFEDEAVLTARALARRERPVETTWLWSLGSTLIEDAGEALDAGAGRFFVGKEAASELRSAVLEHFGIAEPEPEPELDPEEDNQGAGQDSDEDPETHALDLGSSNELLIELAALARHGDYFAILGVDTRASSTQIGARFDELMRCTAPGRVAFRDRPLAEFVREVLRDALQVLGDPALRARYRAALRASDPESGEL